MRRWLLKGLLRLLLWQRLENVLHLLDGHLLGGNAGVLEGLLLQRLADLRTAMGKVN